MSASPESGRRLTDFITTGEQTMLVREAKRTRTILLALAAAGAVLSIQTVAAKDFGKCLLDGLRGLITAGD